MNKFIGGFFFFTLLCSAVRAEEVTITTYYPAPFGSYDELSTTGDTHLGTDEASLVGIGTKNPAAKLEVSVPQTSQVKAFEVRTGPTSSLMVHTDGNVGIGTSSPQIPGYEGAVQDGNLDVNDVYVRSINRWISEGRLIEQVVVAGPLSAVSGESSVRCSEGYVLSGGGVGVEDKRRGDQWTLYSKPTDDNRGWEAAVHKAECRAYAVCVR